MYGLLPYVIGVLVVMAALILRRLSRRTIDMSQYPRDKVTLFQLAGNGSGTPSVSPFGMKLETYLRMAKIPYQNVHGGKMSSKSKSPWIIYKGVEVADSQHCIEYLKRELGQDFNAHLSETERAAARAFQKMTEENLYWPLCEWAFADLSEAAKAFPFNPVFSWLMAWFIRCGIRKEMWGHGIGRHTNEEIMTIGVDDLKALSAQLGNKDFFFGNTPCETDCVFFGMLAVAYWNLEGSPFHALMTGELSNLGAYCERMKATFWSDWDEAVKSAQPTTN